MREPQGDALLTILGSRAHRTALLGASVLLGDVRNGLQHEAVRVEP